MMKNGLKHNQQVKKRLEYNCASYKSAFNRLKRAIDKEDNIEVYASIGELLLWILTTEEWHREHNKHKYERDRKYYGNTIKGLRHAYNMVKHNMEFFEIHRKKIYSSGFNAFTFNSVGFNEYRVVYRWIIIENIHAPDKRYANQYENYIKYIQDKEILSTFKNAINFLDEVNEPFLHDD